MYDPDERMNKLADEVDKNAPLSRLTLFSPCKVLFFLLLRVTTIFFIASCIELYKPSGADKCFLENNQQEGRWVS